MHSFGCQGLGFPKYALDVGFQITGAFYKLELSTLQIFLSAGRAEVSQLVHHLGVVPAAGLWVSGAVPIPKQVWNPIKPPSKRAVGLTGPGVPRWLWG